MRWAIDFCMEGEMADIMMTKWGRALDAEHVLEEYPRPTMVRDSYFNLNGWWDYAIRSDAARPDRYDGKILVPFSPEAPLSGVLRQVKPQEYLHYHRRFVLEPSFLHGRCLLHFGAVDQICTVLVNHRAAGSHTGGYLPFSMDITDLVHIGTNEIEVVVRDMTDTSFHARGKQKLDRGGMWYTAQSGIWQTVWMECVPEVSIAALKIDPLFDEGEVSIKVMIGRKYKIPCRITVAYAGHLVAEAEGKTGERIICGLQEMHPWSPEHPELYDLQITAGEDAVSSYFAMRKVSIGRDSHGVLRFELNNRPYFHTGVLDQGYWPDGLYTAPSDEAFVEDIKAMKDLGFNMLRKHIKVEPERWYYHCDRIGMMVWQDMVNGGGRYHSWFVTFMPNAFMWTGRVISDRHYRLFARADREGRREYYRELKTMVRFLYNHPSIVAWVPFNEGWGQFDAQRAADLLKKLDRGRLVDQASGWFDQGGGDMYSIHNYWRKLKVKPQKGRVTALTECGGYSYQVDGHSVMDKVYGYRNYDSGRELSDGIAGLWENELIPAAKTCLGGLVYTQLSDVEDEVNGLVTYDRAMIKVDRKKMREANLHLLEVFAEYTE